MALCYLDILITIISEQEKTIMANILDLQCMRILN